MLVAVCVVASIYLFKHVYLSLGKQTEWKQQNLIDMERDLLAAAAQCHKGKLTAEAYDDLYRALVWIPGDMQDAYMLALHRGDRHGLYTLIMELQQKGTYERVYPVTQKYAMANAIRKFEQTFQLTALFGAILSVFFAWIVFAYILMFQVKGHSKVTETLYLLGLFLNMAMVGLLLPQVAEIGLSPTKRSLGLGLFVLCGSFALLMVHPLLHVGIYLALITLLLCLYGVLFFRTHKRRE